MKVSVLSSVENISFAMKILNNVDNIEIISNYSDSNLGVSLSQKMDESDIILAIIDDMFFESRYLSHELIIAQASKENSKKLVAVILNNAKIPNYLNATLCFKCDLESKQDILKLQSYIEREASHINYYKKKAQYIKKYNNKLFSHLTLIFSIIIPVIIIFIDDFNPRLLSNNKSDIITFVALIVSLLLIFLTMSINTLSKAKKQWQEEDVKELESYSKRLKNAFMFENNKINLHTNTKKEVDALGRMMINLEDIKEFYTWSQKQAKASFILAVSMCILGFILITITFLLQVIFKFDFKITAITAIGGVITELIAGTALIVYRNSLSQLNHYHKALHEDERFLSSVNLLGKFSTVEAQDEMLREIIRSEIKMNLDSVQEIKNDKID